MRKGSWKGEGVPTLMVAGEGGLTSSVANAGTLVSPALISPPSPLERLRTRGVLMLFSAARGDSLWGVERSGKASVAGIVRVGEGRNSQERKVKRCWKS